MAILFPGEDFVPVKPDLEFIESFDNSQIGGVEKFNEISSTVVSISDVVAKSGDTMTGQLILPASSTSAASLRIPVGTAPTSPTAGDVWGDSAQKTLNSFIDGVNQTLQGCIYTQTSSTTVGNTTNETALTGTGIGTLTLPANFLVIGKTLRVVAYGYITDTGTPDLTIKLKFGSTVLCSTGVVALAGTVSSKLWSVDALVTCRTVGGTGTVFSQGKFFYDDSTHGGTVLGMVSTATVTVDTTATQAVNITATWGTADVSNTMTCTNVIISAIN